MEQSVQISSNMFLGNPCFEKAPPPPKLQKGAPHRPISRINPDKGVDGS